MNYRRKRSKSRTFLFSWIVLLFVAVVSGGGYYICNLESILEADFAQAERLQEEGKYENAARVFETLYKRHPDFYLAEHALFQTAEILNLYLKNHHKALLAYLLVEKDYPDSPHAVKALLQVADIYKNKLRDYPRAIVSYQKILDSGVLDGDRVQYEVADSYFRLNNFEQARIEFESLLKNYPDSRLIAEVQYRVAVSTSLEGDLKKATEVFRLVRSQWPDSAYAVEACFGLAGVLEEREKLTEALKELQGLKGNYPSPEVLEKRINQVKERIKKKKKAI
jgi:TolA-binding protein